MKISRSAGLEFRTWVGKKDIILQFFYTNYKLEKEVRHVRPVCVWYGSSSYHQGEQWFLNAWDLSRRDFRNFAMRDMTEVIQYEEKAKEDA